MRNWKGTAYCTTLLAVLAFAPAGCTGFTRVSGPAPVPASPPRVDTVTVTVERQVAPPLEEGTPAELCLATGYSLAVLISATGDTLIGPRRVPLRELQPGLSFEGRYADAENWFNRSDPIRFERRDYRKFEAPVSLNCEDLKRVGEFNGVPMFADLMVLSPIETLYVPVTPGRFQPYRTTLPRRR